ncbi:alpha/beta fold hydrolase [Streptomyces sp. ISL-36]|uniref:alpha/beta hydrolase n=1 Tax=Streptomyces sp. ISL-36 TaxID=2819182 RepID=UPI001BEABF66|nr:alpha/beta hydrolase [Streptomyces sp. ISL-36]MBT2444880.1 alpha/beta fold hydrolase [Streptomyces sp. ISL-36]
MPISAAQRAVLLTATAVLLAAGCSGSGDKGEESDAPTDFAGLAAQRLEWAPCAPPSAAEGGGPPPSPLPGGAAWECAFMDAPLDYDEPDGETFELALIRARAADPQNRIGSLVFNFGGPGGSGLTALPSFASHYEKLRSRYDLVSFDPRGVGRSEDVECATDKELDAYYALDFSPDDAAEERALSDAEKKYAAGCEEQSGRMLPYVGTENAARDLDLMREVLGDDKLYYFGVSYGTELGGVYAHLFPKKVGRALFDAVVDPSSGTESGALAQAKGFQLALDNFAKDCVARGDACALPGSTVDEIESFITGLLAELDKKPIPGIGDRELTQSHAVNGIAQALYSRQYWQYLEQALDAADGGDGALLLSFSDSMNGRNQNGVYNSLQAANTAVNCVDFKERYTLGQAKEHLSEFRRASPVFGDFMGWSLAGCSDWPVPGVWDRLDVSAPGAAPILVLGTTGDPATPYEGTRAMVNALGKGVGVELTYDGEGHGAYNSGNACVQNTVNAYFLDGKVPASGTVCR